MKDKNFFVFLFFFQSNFNNLLKTVIRLKKETSVYIKRVKLSHTHTKKKRQNLKKKGKCSNFERKGFISYLRLIYLKNTEKHF